MTALIVTCFALGCYLIGLGIGYAWHKASSKREMLGAIQEYTYVKDRAKLLKDKYYKLVEENHQLANRVPQYTLAEWEEAFLNNMGKSGAAVSEPVLAAFVATQVVKSIGCYIEETG